MAESTVNVNLGTSWGAILLVVIVAAALWGASCMQTFLYLMKYPEDRATLKALVVWLWMLDTTHQILITITIYTMLIVNFGDFVSIHYFPLVYEWRIFLLALIGLTTRLFFTHRIWMFSGKNNVFLLVLIPATVATEVTSLANLVEGLSHATVGPSGLNSPFIKRLVYVGNGTSAALDIAFAVIMICLLRKHEIDGMEGSTRMIHRLTILLLMSGAWTAVLNVIVIILLLAFPEEPLWTAVSTMLSPLYCNTVLANLNARTYIRGDDTLVRNENVFGLSALSQKTERQRHGSARRGSRSETAGSLRFSPMITTTKTMDDPIDSC